MQHNRKTLEDALIDVEVSNTHAIALGRRFFALQQEAERIRDEIARVKAKHADSLNGVKLSGDVSEPTGEVERLPSVQSQEASLHLELKSYLDSINGQDFVDGMEWRREPSISLSLNGWAFLSVSEPPLISVTIKAVGADSEAHAQAQRTIRQDVADHFHRPDIPFCGFSAEISLSSLQGTAIDLRIEAVDGEGRVHTQSLGTLNLTP